MNPWEQNYTVADKASAPAAKPAATPKVAPVNPAGRGTPSWMLSSSPAEEGENVSDPTNPFAYIPESQKTEQGAVGKAISRGVQNTMRVGAGLAQGAVMDPAIAIAQMLPGETADQFAKSGAAEYEKFRKGMGGEGFDVSRLIGNVVSPAAIKGAQLVNKGYGMWGKAPGLFKQGATQGALAAGLQPVVHDPDEEDPSFWGEKAKQVGIGAVLGGGLNKLIGKGGNATQFQNPKGVPATPEQLAAQAKTPMNDIQKYREMFPESPLTWGQNIGPRAAEFEKKLTSLPGIGASVQRALEKSFQSQNISMMNKALEPAGIKLSKGTQVGREMFDDAYTQLGKKYDAILEKTTLSNPAELRSKIMGTMDDGVYKPGVVSDDYALLSEAGKKKFDDLIEKGFFQKFGKDPSGQHSVQMTGRQFKTHEEGLKNTIDDYINGVGEDRTIGRMLKNSLKEASDSLQGSTPGVSQELKNINKAYAQFKVLENASTASSVSGGLFSPGQTIKAATKGSRSQVARGKGLLQEEAELSQRVLGKAVPDSGTPGRLFAGNPLVALAGGLVDLALYPFLSPKFATTVMTGGRNIGQGIEGTRLGGFAARHADKITPGAVRYNTSPNRSKEEDEEEYAGGGYVGPLSNMGTLSSMGMGPLSMLRRATGGDVDPASLVGNVSEDSPPLMDMLRKYGRQLGQNILEGHENHPNELITSGYPGGLPIK